MDKNEAENVNGKINKMDVDPAVPTCGMCQVQMTSLQEVDQHYTGKKHAKNQHLHQFKEKEDGKGIFVGSIGQLLVSSIQFYFSQWGTITNIIIIWDKRNEKRMVSLIIEFADKVSVSRILDRKNVFNHRIPYPGGMGFQKVRVHPRIVKPARPRSPSPPQPPQIPFSEIKMKLALSSDMEEQMMEIMELTELTEDDIQERNSICENIRKTFARDGHPNCTVAPFGSTVNGLGFRGCDVDIYLDFGDELPEFGLKPPGSDSKSPGSGLRPPELASKQNLESISNPLISQDDTENSETVSAKSEEKSSDTEVISSESEKKPSDTEVISSESEKKPSDTEVVSKELKERPDTEVVSKEANNGSQKSSEKDEKEYVSQQQKVRLAAKLLRKIQYCSRIHPITAARVPIVKFIHSVSGINCDISFKNKSSVFNSDYIRFCTEQDRRIRPLMMVIRLIFKRYDIGGGGGGTRISNYALTLLIIFYLQQIDKPLLHPVSVLQDCTDKDPERLVNGWNFSFCSDISSLPPLPINKQGLFELFTGFFQFYSTLDFSSYFISPYLGRLVTRLEMKTNVPEEYRKVENKFLSDETFFDRLLCVQDPFELDFNVCRHLPERGLVRVLCVIKSVYEACVSITEKARPGGFNHLMDLQIQSDDSIDLPDPKKAFDSQSVELAFYLPAFKNPNIEKLEGTESSEGKVITEGEATKDSPNSKEDTELNNAQEVINKIFSHCFLFNKVEESETPSQDSGISQENQSEDKKKRKSSHVEEFSTEKKARLETDELVEDDEMPPSVCLSQKWEVHYHVWSGRKKFSQNFENDNTSIIQKEAEITKKLVENVNFEGFPPDIVFRHHLTMYQGRVCIGLEKIKSRKKIYENLFTWLKSYLPDMMKKL